MARIFRDIEGKEHNLDYMLKNATISFDHDIDILDNTITSYYIDYEDNNQYEEEYYEFSGRIVVDKKYYNAVKSIVEQEQTKVIIKDTGIDTDQILV